MHLATNQRERQRAVMTDEASQAQREHCEDLLSPPEPDRQQRDTQTHAERGIVTLVLQIRSGPLLKWARSMWSHVAWRSFTS